MDLTRVKDVLAALNREGVEYVLFGGVAINLQGITRGTQDVDLFVKPDPDNLSRLKRALYSLWPDSEIDKISIEELMGDYPAVCYGPPDEKFTIDIVCRLGDAFAYGDIVAETKDFGGVPVRLTTKQMLYRMKRDTVRSVDKYDCARLVERYGPMEE